MPHVLHVLTVLYAHHHGHKLYSLYLHHGALKFLRSGVTSGSGGVHYLHWLTFHHISPVDW
jgi:hypothetical protein